MKVLHVLDHSLPIHSGYTFRSSSILQEQQSLGWQPFVVTSPKHQMFQHEAVAGEENIAGLAHYRTVDYRQCDVPVIAEIMLMRALKNRIADIVEHARPDIIHAHSPILNALPALWIGKKTRTPVVYEVRSFWEDAAVDHGTYRERSWKYRSVRFLETYACKKADQVVVLSRGLREDLIQRGVAAEKITVIGNGVNPEHFEQNGVENGYRGRWALEGKQVVGFIGSFYRYEGLDLLVEAVAKLCARWPALTLLLVGGGEVEHDLKNQIDHLGLGARVVIAGRIPHDEVPKVYALADILVYPRRSMRLTDIVTPLKPLEAMSMGKAVVGSDVGGHRELITHEKTGVLFQADNVSALVAELDRLLTDKDLRARLGANASRWVRKERSWKKLIAEHAEVYGRALGKPVASLGA